MDFSPTNRSLEKKGYFFTSEKLHHSKKSKHLNSISDTILKKSRDISLNLSENKLLFYPNDAKKRSLPYIKINSQTNREGPQNEIVKKFKNFAESSSSFQATQLENENFSPSNKPMSPSMSFTNRLYGSPKYQLNTSLTNKNTAQAKEVDFGIKPTLSPKKFIKSDLDFGGVKLRLMKKSPLLQEALRGETEYVPDDEISRSDIEVKWKKINEIEEVRTVNRRHTFLKRLFVDSEENRAIGKESLRHEQVLEEGIWKAFPIKNLEFFYFKAKVKNKPCPLSLSIWLEDDKGFKIYVSKHNPFPSKFNCDFNIKAKHSKIYEDNKKSFEFDAYYFSVLCKISTVFKVRINFGELRSKPMSTNMISIKPSKREPGELDIEKVQSPVLFNRIKKIKEKRKIESLKLAKNNKNKLVENMNVDNYVERIASMKRTNFEKRELKSEMALKKREEIELDIIGKRNYTMYKNELFKVVSDINKIKQEKEKKVKRFKKGWMVYINSVNLWMELYFHFRRRLHSLKQIRVLSFRLKRMSQNFIKAIKKKGETNKERLLVDARTCINSMKNHLLQRIKRKAENILVDIISQSVFVNTFNSGLRCYVKKVRVIQDIGREFNLKKYYYKRMLEKYWDKYFPQIYSMICEEKGMVLSPLKIKRIMVADQNPLLKKKAIDKHFQLVISSYKSELQKYLKKIKSIDLNEKKRLLYTQIFLKEESTFIDKLKEIRSELDDDTQELVEDLAFENKWKVDVKKYLFPPRLFILPTFEKLKDVIEQYLREKNM